jgi:NADPH-dependent 2,4-dienoyl-CoA reductase/sulfur reductase-like enzyme/nitrite reductase/ring-hydroxylating ferredoxin subunit
MRRIVGGALKLVQQSYRERPMTETNTLTGPDFASGIAISDLAENTPIVGHAHGEAIVLVRTGTEVRAVGAKCTHYGGPLHEGLVVGGTLRCPWHHARFDLGTGEALGAPALNPIACFEVQRRGDRVVVGPRRSRSQPDTPPRSPAAVVIIGAGAAGAAAAERLRRLGCRGSITLVGDEAPGPVDRPNLSKDYLAGTAPEEWLPLRPPEFYDEIGVALRIGDAVVGLDPTRKTLALESGDTLSYDALLLATGAAPVRLPMDGATQEHVFTLRTLADSQRIIAATSGARRAVVIGSSFIGLEVAAALRTRGLEVDVVGRDRLPLERVLGADVGRFVQQLHEAHGVRFHLGTSPRAIRTDSVELEDGRKLAADLVVMGVGVRPRTGLAEKAGLRVADGIVVDAFLRTRAPGIWAAGDCARYPEPRLGKPVRIEHWVVAERQGQAVARDMVGLGAPFQDVPFFWSQHYDVTLAYVGHADSWDDVELRGSLAEHDALVVYRHAGRALAVVTVGRDRQSLAIEAALERGDDTAVEAIVQS